MIIEFKIKMVYLNNDKKYYFSTLLSLTKTMRVDN